MKQFPFTKVSPSGNMTIFIHDLSPSLAERMRIAVQVMRRDHLDAEQVAFVDDKIHPPALEMMGGELCVNACRAMAALLCSTGRLPKTGKDGWMHGHIRASGVPGMLDVKARPRDDIFESAVCLAFSDMPVIEAMDEGIHLTHLPGICHLIIDANKYPEPADMKLEAACLRARYNLENEKAVGCSWLTVRNRQLHLTPVVWVRGYNDAVLENACGSATLACAIMLRALPEYGGQINIFQPSGEYLSIEFEEDNSALLAWTSGQTRFIAGGMVSVY
jgi:diaminopimelate epimerase